MQSRRRGLLPSMPLPAINLATLLTDKEENLKPEQMNVSHISVMDLLGDPSNPLYTEPLSMAKHFDAMMAGTHAIGELPGRTRCRDDDATAHIYEEEAKQVRQKILRYLDMRVMDRDLVVPTCLWMPTLILPAGRSVVMYYDPDAREAGTVCLSVPYWRSGLHATSRGHQDIHRAQELLCASRRCAIGHRLVLPQGRAGEKGGPG